MFSRWIVTNITFDRGTVHCRKNRIPCGDHLVICGLSISRNNSEKIFQNLLETRHWCYEDIMTSETTANQSEPKLNTSDSNLT
jgi:hypothetical protein